MFPIHPPCRRLPDSFDKLASMQRAHHDQLSSFNHRNYPSMSSQAPPTGRFDLLTLEGVTSDQIGRVFDYITSAAS